MYIEKQTTSRKKQNSRRAATEGGRNASTRTRKYDALKNQNSKQCGQFVLCTAGDQNTRIQTGL